MNRKPQTNALGANPRPSKEKMVRVPAFPICALQASIFQIQREVGVSCSKLQDALPRIILAGVRQIQGVQQERRSNSEFAVLLQFCSETDSFFLQDALFATLLARIATEGQQMNAIRALRMLG